MLYSNIGTDNACAGVAILLHAKHIKNNICIHMISGRVIAVDFMVNGRRFCGISVYAPHRGYSADDLDETCNQLRCIVGKAQRANKRIVIVVTSTLNLELVFVVY